MAKIIGVRFRNAGKVYYFNPGRYIIKAGSAVIVETVQGVEYGDVTIGTKDVPDEEIVAPLKDIIRVATVQDIEQARQNREKEKLAFQQTEKKILQHNLDMKLVRVEYTFDAAKIVFYFTSDGRVDFRELVKDLAQTYKPVLNFARSVHATNPSF
jgi:cell fate regulator YaaT (PSP1 superfamily)